MDFLSKFVVTSAIKVEARNVTNIDEIDQYVQSLLDRAKTDQAKKWLTKTFRKYLINHAPAKESNGIIVDFESVPIMSIIDYLNTLDNINFGYDQAKKKSDAWHKQLAQKTGEYSGDDSSKIVKKYKNGYTWRLLQTKEDYIREGDRMGHCVGTYEPGNQDIYSLRSPSNKPHITIEIDSEYFIHQLKGKADLPPFKYKKYAVDFLKTTYKDGVIKAHLPEDIIALDILLNKKRPGKHKVVSYYPEELNGKFVDELNFTTEWYKETLQRVGLYVTNNVIIHEKKAIELGTILDVEESYSDLASNIDAHLVALQRSTFLDKFDRLHWLETGQKFASDEEYVVLANNSFASSDRQLNYFCDANGVIRSFKDYSETIPLEASTAATFLSLRDVIPTKQGMLSIKKVARNEVSFSNTAFNKQGLREVLEDITRRGYYPIPTEDSISIEPVASLIEKQTKNYTKITSVPFYSYSGTGKLQRIINTFDVGGMFTRSGPYFDHAAMVDKYIVPFELLTSEVCKVCSKDAVIRISGSKLERIPTDFWTNIPSKLEILAEEKMDLPVISCSSKIVFAGSEKINAVSVEAPEFIFNGEDLKIGTIKAKKFKIKAANVSINKAVVREFTSNYAENLFVGDLTATNLKIDHTSAVTIKDLTLSDKSKIDIADINVQIDTISFNYLPEISLIGGGSINNQTTNLDLYLETIKKATILDNLVTSKHTPNVGYLFFHHFVVAFKYNHRKRMNVRKLFQKETSKRLWEIQLLHYTKDLRFRQFYYKIDEIKKAFSVVTSLKKVKRNLKQRHPFAVVEPLSEKSLFTNRTFKKLAIKRAIRISNV